MNAVPRYLLAGAAIVLVMLALGAASRYPLGARQAAAELRLSWRMRAGPERVCRIRTSEELARLPPHMREEEVCERRSIPYRLKVTVDGAAIEDRRLVPAGAQGDRPLYVFGRFLVAPGPRAVRLELSREGGDQEDATSAHNRTAEAPTHALPQPAPLRLTLDTALALVRGEVVVVTYDPQRERLRVIGSRAP